MTIKNHPNVNSGKQLQEKNVLQKMYFKVWEFIKNENHCNICVDFSKSLYQILIAE